MYDEHLEKGIKVLVMERDITYAEAEAIVMVEENDLNNKAYITRK